MARKAVAAIQYANPSLVPANLRKVAGITYAEGEEPANLVAYDVTYYLVSDTIPGHLELIGLVPYNPGDTIPGNMKVIAAMGDLFYDPFDGSVINTNYWTVTDTTPELLSNPGFETLGAGTPDIFTNWTETFGDGDIADYATAHAGEHAAYVGGGATANTNLAQTITGLLASREYDISLWVRALTAGMTAGRYGIYDVSNSAYITAVTTTGVTTETYTQVSTRITTPVGCTSIRVEAWCPTTDGHIALFDDMSIKAAPAISVSGGKFRISGGKAAPGWADPAAVSKAPYVWAREAGLTIEWQITPDATNQQFAGFTDGSLATDQNEPHGLFIWGPNCYVIAGTAVGIAVPSAYSAGQSLWVKIVCKATGAFYYISADSRATWQLIWIDSTVTTSPLYAFIESYDAALTSDGVRVFLGTVKPAVLSVTPAAPTLTPGDDVIVNGGFGADTNWTKGTNWTIAGGVAVATAVPHTTGIRNTGVALSAGTWYVMEADITVSGGGFVFYVNDDASNPSPIFAITGHTAFVNRSGSSNPAPGVYTNGETTGTVDNVTQKPLPFTTGGALKWLGTSGQHNGIYWAHPTITAGYHGGIVAHADSATAPSNALYAYYDVTAGKAYLLKVVAGVTTELKSATIAYSAGAEITIVSNGTSHAAYYGSAIVDSVQTALDVSGWGLNVFGFQTNAADSLGACEVNT